MLVMTSRRRAKGGATDLESQPDFFHFQTSCPALRGKKSAKVVGKKGDEKWLPGGVSVRGKIRSATAREKSGWVIN